MLSGGIPIPAATHLTFNPIQPAPITAGQVEIFSLTASNANGVALANEGEGSNHDG